MCDDLRGVQAMSFPVRLVGCWCVVTAWHEDVNLDALCGTLSQCMAYAAVVECLSFDKNVMFSVMNGSQ